MDEPPPMEFTPPKEFCPVLPATHTPNTDDATMDYGEERNLTIAKKRKRYGSGLGNLGNTCFMNSTLQCLAHTEPLRKYFVTGEYKSDLNLENPLGTGGELATQFAELLGEMFGASSSSSYNNVVYPRSFKYCLGKHAEQFVGYDQHDSQELATYLLDALHEDTNRVTKKPYVEKPEQGETETDEVAAEKAWNSHLKREDSKVLENFMGQVKSRVQCPKPGCGRVSTTFDPFMYLSVPIPGSTDRNLKVTYKPINGAHRNLVLTVSKMASISTMLKKLVENVNASSKTKVDASDLLAADVWNNEVYSVYKADDEIDKIRDNDKTFVYELRSISSFSTTDDDDPARVNGSDEPEIETRTKNRLPFLDMESPVIDELDKNDKWIDLLGKKLVNSTTAARLTNPKRATVDERMHFYNQLESFLDKCIETSDFQAQDDEKEDAKKDDDDFGSDELPSIQDVCSRVSMFKDVSTKEDISMLEFAAKKLRLLILGQMNNEKYKECIIVQVLLKNRTGRTSRWNGGSTDGTFTLPLCMRIPGNCTVYEFRKELAGQLPLLTNSMERTIEDDRKMPTMTSDVLHGPNEGRGPPESAHAATVENQPTPIEDLGSSQMLIMRQVPMSFDRKGSYTYKTSYSSPRLLGMLDKPDDTVDGSRLFPLASPTDEKEQELVADMVGPGGTVHLHWPEDLSDRCFDQGSWEDVEEDENVQEGHKTRKSQKATTVAECIEKYCQMEQLEESEMWYCDQCKEHVRAWKQFHLYRAPPILIIHLKRFHYSASTHRRDKIDHLIDFPLKGLDLTKEVMHWSEDEKTIYDCYAVSNHYGGLGGGHYTAYAMSTDGVWCHFDDSRVTTGIDPGEVVSSAAYVLYYRRRDVVFDGKDLEAPLPAIVVGHAETSARDDNMDIDDKAVMTSPTSSPSTSPMGSIVNQDDSDDSVYVEPNFDNEDMPLQ
jgi:ubiquitin carboxyl-terminal hydrolase 4/11